MKVIFVLLLFFICCGNNGNDTRIEAFQQQSLNSNPNKRIEVNLDNPDLTSLYYSIQEEHPLFSHQEIVDCMYDFIFDVPSGNISLSYSGSYDYGINDDEFWTIVGNLWPWEYTTVIDIKDRAISKTVEFYGSNSWRDDGDAFRHTCFAAILTLRFGASFAQELTDAHESEAPLGLDRNMDLHNNSRGISLYDEWYLRFDDGTGDRWDNLANFVTHCVSYGSIYDILRCDVIDTPQKLVYTTIGMSNPSTFPVPYIEAFVTPEDYGFEQQYFFYSKDKIVPTENSWFDTHRLRTGYIEQEFIVLSPRRSGAGTAFLEYHFPEPIIEIDIELALWSSSEYLNIIDSEAKLKYKDSTGNWIEVLDLLRDVTLSTNRQFADNFRLVFPDGIFAFGIFATSSPIGDRNKGRICIGDLRVFTDSHV